ncbi:MAG TPA: type ISP restriction/modification enzyme, partial [Ktedonobacterales bacterium]
LAPALVEQFAERLEVTWRPDGTGDLIATFGPEDILAYVYALLYAPSFRARHAGALRTDFPRIPAPSDLGTFRSLCQLGAQLVALHLGKHNPASVPQLDGVGNNRVEQVRYVVESDGEQGVAHINGMQSFEGVAQEVWTFSIGGYQVARKWLQDRRGRVLTDEDVRRYQEVLKVIRETCALMRRIDERFAASQVIG